MVTSVVKGGIQKLPKKVKIVEISWHDHSLESSWDHVMMAPFISISFSIQPSKKKKISEFFSKNLSP
jgi:hypothetical protein